MGETLADTGGGFLLSETPADAVFTPESLTEEHEAIVQTTEEFLRNEFATDTRDLPGTLRRAADLGLTAVLIAERHGGMELDLLSAALVAERLGAFAGLARRYCAHSGAATLPLVWHGTEEQKERLLTRIASGELLAAAYYPESLGPVRAVRAVPAGDGLLLMTAGVPMLNAESAGVFVTLATLEEGETLFAVERTLAGVRVNRAGEVVFESVKVTAGDRIGEAGMGRKVAGQAAGAESLLLSLAAVGAISECRNRAAMPGLPKGSAQQELAQLVTQAYVAESVVFRAAGRLNAAGSLPERFEEFAAECRLARALSTSALGDCLDVAARLRFWVGEPVAPRSISEWRHAVFPADWIGAARILIDRAREGRLPLPAAAKKLAGEIMALPPSMKECDPVQEALAAAAGVKRATLLCLGSCFRKYGGALDEEQEVMERIGRLAGLAYGVESAALRGERTGGTGAAFSICRIHARTVLRETEDIARGVLAACASGDTLRTDLALLGRVTAMEPADLIGLRRDVAEFAIAEK